MGKNQHRGSKQGKTVGNAKVTANIEESCENALNEPSNGKQTKEVRSSKRKIVSENVDNTVGNDRNRKRKVDNAELNQPDNKKGKNGDAKNKEGKISRRLSRKGMQEDEAVAEN